jgi:hypothetical protein
MGNSVPSESNNDWVVIPLDRTCIAISIPSHTPDPRMLALLPGGQPEYAQRVAQFESTYNPMMSRMYKYLGGAAIFSMITGNLGTRMFDGEVGPVLVLGYIPLMFALVYMYKTMTSLKEVIRGIFSSWEAHGLKCDFFAGNKHSKPRLGFEITDAGKQRLAEAGQQPAPGQQQQQQQMMMMQPGQQQQMFMMPPGQQMQAGFQPQMQAMPGFQPAMMAQPGQQPANFDPMTGAPLAPVATATVVPDNKVQVQVPAYGGGGVTGVMYNGAMISVEIPKDAQGGAIIWVDVPDAYRK